MATQQVTTVQVATEDKTKGQRKIDHYFKPQTRQVTQLPTTPATRNLEARLDFSTKTQEQAQELQISITDEEIKAFDFDFGI